MKLHVSGSPVRADISLDNLTCQALRPSSRPNAAYIVNERFGKGAIAYGDASPDQTSKIAFQRVPMVKEF